MVSRFVLSGLLALSLASCASQEKSDIGTDMAKAAFISPKKEISGEVNFRETEEGILVSADVKGLRPGSVHGFHVHEKGKCDFPDFKSAGGHYNPEDKPHAGPGAPEKHAGDFGNLIADSQGHAKKELLLTKKEVKDLRDIEGKAIILHEKADDLTTQPTGDAGDRLACGLIRRVES